MQEQTFQKKSKKVPIGLGRHQTDLKNRMRPNAANRSESAELGPRGPKLAISRWRRILVLADTTRAIISVAEQGLSKLIVFTNLLKPRWAHFQLTFIQPRLCELLYGNYEAERTAHLQEQVLHETAKDLSIGLSWIQKL